MRNFLSLRLNRFVPTGLLALVAAALLAPATANATPYVVTLIQQGGNVVATGSGEFDLTGLTLSGSFSDVPGVIPTYAYLMTGGTGSFNFFTGLSGPATFGAGTSMGTNSFAGDLVVVQGQGGFLGLLPGYVSGSVLTSSATFDNQSLASLGVTPGTYVWTWGSGADQSFTLDIVSPTAVPEPAALGTFGFGLLAIGAFVGLRRRTA